MLQKRGQPQSKTKCREPIKAPTQTLVKLEVHTVERARISKRAALELARSQSAKEGSSLRNALLEQGANSST